MQTHHMSIAAAEDWVTQVLVAHRTTPANAASVARALVLAEADGQKGHGLSRLTAYAAQARSGKVDGAAVPVATRTAPAVVTIDACHGFAYPALELAIDRLTPVARQQGIALAGITRSHHCGVLAHVMERLAAEGLVAFMVANTPAAMAPWGGRRALFGTNPIGCAFPRPGHDPVVIDLALSKVARGHVVHAQQRGTQIPPDWALDADGQPTTDPAAALAGTMVPLGEAKGAALALMVEALAAGLTGSRYAYEASSFLDAAGEPPGTGQVLIAIDPQMLGGAAVLDHLATLFATVADETGGRLPGSRRYAHRRDAEANGIEVPAAIWDAVQPD